MKRVRPLPPPLSLFLHLPDLHATYIQTVEYRLEKPMYAYQGNELPVQWSAWMRRTRQLPPSLEELQEDQVRAVKLQQNVERLKLEYAAEKERLTATHQLPTPSVSLPESSTSPASQQHLQHDIATSIEPDAQIGESDQAAQHQKHQAAEESVRKQPLGQAPSPDAQRPGAQALKRQGELQSRPFLSKRNF